MRRAPDLLGDLARVGSRTTGPGRVLGAAAPLVAELAGARAVLLVRATGEGYRVDVLGGEPLDGTGVAAGLLTGDRQGLSRPAVPAPWRSAGIAQVGARRLPGDAGVLVLAWSLLDEARLPSLELGLDLLDAGLARAQAEYALADLEHRVDTAQGSVGGHAPDGSSVLFGSLVESSPDAIVVFDGAGAIVQANARAHAMLGQDPVGANIRHVLREPLRSGQGQLASGLDGRVLRLDVTVAPLSRSGDVELLAAFLHDASVRLVGEALAVRLRDAETRRRQAVEINDNVVQGLAAAGYALTLGDAALCSHYLDTTLAAARGVMTDLLDPRDGEAIQAGDLVRSQHSRLGEVTMLRRAAGRPSRHRSGLRRVLIADDYEDMRVLIRLELEKLGTVEVVGEAADGAEAVRLATDLQPDLVLLDLAMPVLDGLQALPLIKDAVPGVRVVVLSGFDHESAAEQALAAGASRYVEKGARMNLAGIVSDALAPTGSD